MKLEIIYKQNDAANYFYWIYKDGNCVSCHESLKDAEVGFDRIKNEKSNLIKTIRSEII